MAQKNLPFKGLSSAIVLLLQIIHYEKYVLYRQHPFRLNGSYEVNIEILTAIDVFMFLTSIVDSRLLFYSLTSYKTSF